MPEPTRQLAAILFADIAGYTALMRKDSKKVLDLVRQGKQIQKPPVEKHNGKWLKEMGDGTSANFKIPMKVCIISESFSRDSEKGKNSLELRSKQEYKSSRNNVNGRSV